MYPPSPYAVPYGSFPIPVSPPGIGPFDGELKYIPINCAWLPYIAGALTQLLLQSTWRVNSDDELFRVQGQAFDLIAKISCIQLPSLADLCTQFGNSGAETEEFMIRQNPSNPCELQTSVDGINWCTFADLSKCIPANGQPGSGSQQPSPGGGQACYQAKMQGSGKWLLPTNVNSGDVIVVSGTNGAATDGSGIWYCPNGQTYFLGACAGATTTSSGDPLNTSPHMSLIAKINGVYYEMYNATLTVPGGVTNSIVEFQLNDSSLSDNFGEIDFQACVTNNATAAWTKTFDFTTSDGGFSSDVTNAGAAYIPGTGWQSNNSALNAFSIHRTGLSTFDLTEAQWTIVADSPTGGANLYTDGDLTPIFTAVGYAGTGTQVKTFTGSIHITSGHLRFGMDGTNDSGGHHQILRKVVLYGTGVSPF